MGRGWGGAGAELGGLQRSRPDVMKEGGKRMEGGEEALISGHRKTVILANIFGSKDSINSWMC